MMKQRRELKNKKSLADVTDGSKKNIRASHPRVVPIESGSDSDDDLPLANVQEKLRRKRRHRKYLPTVARACDRLGISDRAAAAIAAAVLQDFGIVSKEDSFKVVDRNKVRRSRLKNRDETQKRSRSNLLRSLYFDGRKDLTFITTRKGSRWYKKKIIEEHISMIHEPGSDYIGHVTPSSGSAKAITDSMISFLKER